MLVAPPGPFCRLLDRLCSHLARHRLQALKVDQLAEQLEELGLGQLALEFDSHDALKALTLRRAPAAARCRAERPERRSKRRSSNRQD